MSLRTGGRGQITAERKLEDSGVNVMMESKVEGKKSIGEYRSAE